MSNLNMAATVAVVALAVWLARGIPYLAFGRRKLPEVVIYIGNALPASIMVILVVYCLRNLSFTVYPNGLPEIISVAVVALTQFWKKNAVLSIVLGTVCYMVLIRTVFAV